MKTSLLLLAQVGFIALTLICYAIVLYELKSALTLTSFASDKQKKIWRSVFVSILFWLIVISVLALTGFIQDFSAMPPRLIIVLIIPLPVTIWIAFSKAGKEILNVIPPQNIIRLQVFRVFVEILLWLCFIQNMLPVQMTFEGRNFDILAGLTAPFIAYLCFTKQTLNKSIAIVWNMVSLGLLINIVTIAIVSAPVPFRVFMNEPANTLVTHFPFVWLPGFLVPLAYGLHILSLRQLLSAKTSLRTAS